jgi:hypothetical protein
MKYQRIAASIDNKNQRRNIEEILIKKIQKHIRETGKQVPGYSMYFVSSDPVNNKIQRISASPH